VPGIGIRSCRRRPYRAHFALAALAAAVGVLCLQPAMASAVKWKLSGRGFGHGIGMSQYGAEGMARKGKNFREIIKHYYTGVDVTPSKTRSIRVLLQASVSRVKLRGATRASGGRSLAANRTYTVKRSGSALRLYDGDKLIATYNDTFIVTGSKPIKLLGRALNGRSGGTYRGGFELSRGVFGGVTAVNDVGIDDYVQGVIPGEVPPAWRMETLKAQAVAARTYALATDAGGSVFDQYPDTRSQVYLGVSGEHSRSNQAARETSELVATYKGKIATTFFFSTSGGRTENVENVFYGSDPKPWLKSVEDPYDDISPRHTWSFTFSNSRLAAKLGSTYVKGSLRSIKVVKRGVSPRVVKARVVGTRGTTTITGATLRARLGLPDTWVKFKKVG
jgi:stage II sporulation protein D